MLVPPTPNPNEHPRSQPSAFVGYSNDHLGPMQAGAPHGHFLWLTLGGLRSRNDQKKRGRALSISYVNSILNPDLL